MYKVLLSCFDRKLLCYLALALTSVGHRISCYFGGILEIIGLFCCVMSRYAISHQNISSENHKTWDYTLLQLNKGRSRHSWPGGVLLQLSSQDLQIATGILLNHLDIAAVNALVIWLSKDPTWNAKKISSVFYENWVCANPTTNGTSSNATGNVFGAKLSREGICSGNVRE